MNIPIILCGPNSLRMVCKALDGEAQQMLAEHSRTNRYMMRIVRAITNENFEKIDSEVAFITAGLKQSDGLFYAAIMIPNPISEKNRPWIPLAKMHVGFALSESAKMEASKDYPLVPVIMDKISSLDKDKFTYPCYTTEMAKKARHVIKADERRKRRAEKLTRNARRNKK